MTKTKTVTYKVAMTEQQAKNLCLLLETGVGGHINELTIEANYGQEVADDVRETCGDLLHALENRET